MTHKNFALTNSILKPITKGRGGGGYNWNDYFKRFLQV